MDVEKKVRDAVYNNLFQEIILKLFSRKKEGISIGRKKIRYIRFADSLVNLADDMKVLQKLIEISEKGMNECGMQVNLGKLKAW